MDYPKRSEKYSKEYEATANPKMSRREKNASLYKEMSNEEIENFDVNSNVKVLDQNPREIDINKIREMLDKKYREPEVSKPLAKLDEEPYKEVNLEETREYDINSILEAAKDNKEVDYETERLKKLRNTQMDILNNLDLNMPKVKEEEKGSPEEEKLRELIDTITLKEEENKGLDPLDLLKDLKGSENTMVIPPVETPLMNNEVKENKEEVKEEDKTKTNEIDNSFYTTSSVFTQSDFDDFNDLKEDVESTKTIIKVLIVVVVIAFIVGIFFILNRVLGWGLFGF